MASYSVILEKDIQAAETRPPTVVLAPRPVGPRAAIVYRSWSILYMTVITDSAARSEILDTFENALVRTSNFYLEPTRIFLESENRTVPINF